jgi:hypothetical protein
MTKNPILDDLRKTREKLLSEAGGTLEGLVRHLQQAERQSNRNFVRPKGETCRRKGAAQSDISNLESGPAAH